MGDTTEIRASDLRQHLAEVLNDTAVHGRITYVTRNGPGVIEDTTLPLTRGMNVITGETGAGKTMVVTGLGLLFGGRADAARVRAEPGRAVVEGRLRLTGAVASSVAERVVDAGSEPDEDGSVLLARTVTAEGRSRAHVGGRAVPVAVLGELGEQVVAVHGQSDQ